jgi:amidase
MVPLPKLRAQTPRSMTHDEYVSHDATALAQLVRSGEVTPTELLEIALARIEALNPKLNAVVRLMADDARRDAARADVGGEFAGVPFLAKDLLSTYEGHPTSGSSRLTANLVADHDSELVRRVRATGVTVAGKTNLPEWGLPPYTESVLWGACHNPWNLSRTPGGSSGGSACAVAAGMVPMASGGDGGGSIRIPASCCGIFGFKPTRGRTPTGPDFGELWRGAVVEHVLTRSVRDSARMLDATQGADVGAPYEIVPPTEPYANDVDRDPGTLRIAWTTEPQLRGETHPDCARAVEDAVALLGDLGHQMVEASPAVDADAFARAFLTMVAGELGADLTDVAGLMGRRARRHELEPTTWALGLVSDALSSREFATALRTLERVGRTTGPFFEEYDLLLTPTVSTPPPPIGSLAPSKSEDRLLRLLGTFGSGRLVRAAGLLDEAVETLFDFIPWTPVSNVTGQPAMSVPLFWNDEGLPIGVHFVARFADEATLFRLAGQLERARPWFDRLPAIATSP